jgi:hypothetical protein
MCKLFTSGDRLPVIFVPMNNTIADPSMRYAAVINLTSIICTMQNEVIDSVMKSRKDNPASGVTPASSLY